MNNFPSILFISEPDGQRLHFVQRPSANCASSSKLELAVALTLNIEGDVVCNGYAAEFALEENILTLSNTETTADSCERDSEEPNPTFSRVLLNDEGSNMLSIIEN